MRTTREPGDNRIVHIYESIGDYLKAINVKPDRREGASHRTESGDNPWSGSKSFAEAWELCQRGWHESRPKVDAILEPLREKLADKLSVVSERSHDMIGYEPDIDRFLAGELECMWEDVFVPAPANGRVYTLLVSGAVNSHVSPETLMKRGVAIVALVEAFQMVGSDVEIWTEESYTPGGFGRSNDPNRSWSALTRIHRAGENLDIDAIMFPLSHPSWFRRFSFAAVENESPQVRDEFGFHLGMGYGRAADLRCIDIIEPTFTLTKGGESRDTRQLDSDPLGFILETLKDQGAFRDDDEWGN